MSKQKQVPASKMSRIGHFGGLLSNIVANMAVDGVKELSRGKVPDLKSLLLSGKNITHLSERLARLRGAAMKMGQLLSMDAGDLLPDELNQLLHALRDNAYTLPEAQLQQVLEESLGSDWQTKFADFDIQPFAAASIGQVHRATSLTQQALAVKIQYPGISQSIHSDVDNMATLMKMSGLVPKSIDLTRLLLEVKMQLIREADYSIELRYLQRYKALLADDERFVIPQVNEALSSERMLVMSFEEGNNIEEIAQLAQPLKNQICESLVYLLFKELFDFKLMQTDPNFANYLYQPASHKIVLLDFGATRDVDESLSRYYLDIARAVINNDMQAVLRLATEQGFFVQGGSQAFQQEMLATFAIAAEPTQFDGPYDFAGSDVLQRLKARLPAQAAFREYFGTPPGDAVFIHRKIAGMYLLLSRVGATINLRSILTPFL